MLMLVIFYKGMQGLNHLRVIISRLKEGEGEIKSKEDVEGVFCFIVCLFVF